MGPEWNCGHIPDWLFRKGWPWSTLHLPDGSKLDQLELSESLECQSSKLKWNGMIKMAHEHSVKMNALPAL